MFKVALDAGHGYNTAGKRTPDDEREWGFNNKVVNSAMKELEKYENVEVQRMDDPTGKTDVPLKNRSGKANIWGANVYVSVHHNASTGKWGTWTGTDTFTCTGSQPASERLQKCIHPRLLKAYELKDRGMKKANYHVVRETKMPAILTEGGFMDSLIDIKKLRDDNVLKNAGIAIAQGIAEFGNLKLKKVEPAPAPAPKPAGIIEKPVNKKVKVLVNALYTYKSADWSDKGIIVKKGEVFTVVAELMVKDSLMLKLKSGLYISGSPKYVQIY